MKIQKININEKFEKISDHWSPRVIAEMNNYQFKLAKVKDEFIWHKHDDSDDTFFIINGNLTIEFINETEYILKLNKKIIIPFTKIAKQNVQISKYR